MGLSLSDSRRVQVGRGITSTRGQNANSLRLVARGTSAMRAVRPADAGEIDAEAGMDGAELCYDGAVSPCAVHKEAAHSTGWELRCARRWNKTMLQGRRHLTFPAALRAVSDTGCDSENNLAGPPKSGFWDHLHI